MPGDIEGYSCSAQFIVASLSPLDPKAVVSPAAIKRGLEAHVTARGFPVPGVRGRHKIVEANVYMITPTLTSIRTALKLATPWTKGHSTIKITKRTQRPTKLRRR